MTATYTFDVFTSLDGYGAASGNWTGYWGKQGPELLDHRLALYGAEQRMVFGANTYRGGAATANGPQCDLAAAVQWASTPDAGGECDRLLYWASVGKAAANRPEDDCPAPLTGARCMWDPPVAKGVSSMDGEVRLQLVEDGADAERLDTLTGYLRSELLQLDVEDVSRVQTGDVPPGARAIDVVALGGLIVSLGRTATGLKDVVAAVRRWLSGGDGVRRTVKIEIDGDTLELSEVSAAEQDRLVDLFVRRHSGDEG